MSIDPSLVLGSTYRYAYLLSQRGKQIVRTMHYTLYIPILKGINKPNLKENRKIKLDCLKFNRTEINLIGASPSPHPGHAEPSFIVVRDQRANLATTCI